MMSASSVVKSESDQLPDMVDETKADKEVVAIGNFFQQIVNELKNGIPNFEEFVQRATKLHGTLKTTIVVLGSFLDSFQKIADAATNTKGATRDIGTCLTRIVMRHRAMESRMKSLAGALMDCMVMPIQNHLDDWKKVSNTLDKDHARDFKKRRVHIKRRADQVSRLRKKVRKTSNPGGVAASPADPSTQRMLETCSNELSTLVKQSHEREKKFLRKVLIEERSRYCTFANCLRPLIDEEFGLLGELHQVEEVVHKLAKVTCNPSSLPETCENVIQDLPSRDISTCDISSLLTTATPPATPPPSQSMGSRKNSMSSISSMTSMSSRASSVIASSSFDATSPTHSNSSSQLQDDVSLSGSVRSTNLPLDKSSITHQEPAASRPSSASGPAGLPRPHTISASFGHQHFQGRPQLTSTTFISPNSGQVKVISSEPASPSKGFLANGIGKNQSNASIFEQGLSTIKRVYSNRSSPFRRPPSVSSQKELESNVPSGRPPLPQRCSSVDRSSSFNRMSSASPHYAVPRKMQMVPDFHAERSDMVIPQPIYLNTNELFRKDESGPSEEDLKTPTVEELSFPGQKTQSIPVEDGSSTSSSGSIGSSSGYGSQSTILTKSMEEASMNRKNNNANDDTRAGPAHYSTRVHVISPIYENRHMANAPDMITTTTASNDVFSWTNFFQNSLNRRKSMHQLKRSDSFTPGYPTVYDSTLRSNNPSATLHRSSSIATKIPPPAPPVRRTPSLTSNSNQVDPDDDATPHGSIENVSGDPDSESIAMMVMKASNVADNLQRFQAQEHQVQQQPGLSSILRRSTSMSNGPSSLPHMQLQQGNGDQLGPRDHLARRSLNIKESNNNQVVSRIPQMKSGQTKIPQPNSAGRVVTFAPNPPTSHNNGTYNQVATRHVITVKAEPHKAKPESASPEAEIYGFGMKFRESSRQYFGDANNRHPSTSQQQSSIPVNQNDEVSCSSFQDPRYQQQQSARAIAMSKEALQNQIFLDSLTAKLTGSVHDNNGSRVSTVITTNNPNPSESNSSTLQRPNPRNEYHF